MSESVSLAEAKARLSACIRRVERGEPLVITRHGAAVAALVPPADLAELVRLRRAGPQGGLLSLAGGWEDSDHLLPSPGGIDRPSTRSVPDLP